MSDERDHPYPPTIHPGHRSKRIAIGLLAAPFAWLVHLVASYAAVVPTCGASAPWVMHAALTVGALLIAISGGLFSFSALRSLPAGAFSQDDNPSRNPRHADAQATGGRADSSPTRATLRDPRAEPRNELLAATAIVNSVFFSVIIVLSWTATLVISPCAP